MLEEDFTEGNDRPSKTKMKEAMHELQDLGAELVDLSVGQLKRVNLPEDLLAAVRECQKINSHGARRRQIMYIGKMLRNVDEEPIPRRSGANSRRLGGRKCPPASPGANANPPARR
jgi:ribosome-associated protein